jgi:hypothetical protein
MVITYQGDRYEFSSVERGEQFISMLFGTLVDAFRAGAVIESIEA